MNRLLNALIVSNMEKKEIAKETFREFLHRHNATDYDKWFEGETAKLI